MATPKITDAVCVDARTVMLIAGCCHLTIEPGAGLWHPDSPQNRETLELLMEAETKPMVLGRTGSRNGRPERGLCADRDRSGQTVGGDLVERQNVLPQADLDIVSPLLCCSDRWMITLESHSSAHKQRLIGESPLVEAAMKPRAGAFFFAACAVLFAFAVAASASPVSPMRFSVFWPCGGNASFCTPQVLAQGVIERDSAAKFAKFLSNKAAHEHELPPEPVISFDSPGGNVAGAVDLGRLIRRLKFDTNLAPEYSRVPVSGQGGDPEAFVRDAVCASACTLAFLGGVTRSLADGAKFGVHQFAGQGRNIGDSATQLTMVALAGYVEDMGVDRRMLDLASLVAPNQLFWVSVQQAQALRIDNTLPPRAAWTIKALASGLPYVQVLQSISAGRKVHISLAVEDGRGVVVVTMALMKDGGPDRVGRFPLGEPPDIVFTADEREISTTPLTPWSKISETAEGYVFQAMSTMSLSALRLLGSANTLAVSDSFPHATQDLSLGTILSTENLASGISLLLRTK